MREHCSPLRLAREDLDAVLQAVGSRWQALRGQRLLLTGGTGFVGKWMLATFLHANRVLGLDAKVVVLSRDVERFLQQFPGLRDAPEVEWLQADVRGFELGADQACAYCIHAATDVVASPAPAPAQVLDTCLSGTSRVLANLRQGGPRRLLLLSSGAVYGPAPTGMTRMDESWPGAPDCLKPASAYGEGKRVSELLCAMTSAQDPLLEVSVARCFAFVGPHMALEQHFAIGNFIAAALAGRDIHIQGDGTPLRSYLYAADLAHWLWVLLFEGPDGRAFNVGGAEGLSIAGLAERVKRVLQAPGAIRVARTPEPGAAAAAYLPDLQRVGNELGLTPQVDLDEAIRRTARWALEQRHPS